MASQIGRLENALRSIRSAQRTMAAEYELNSETNTFARELPEWAAAIRDNLHHAHDAIVNAIDPDHAMTHGWWERL